METNFSTAINSNSTNNITANDSRIITDEAGPDRDDFLQLLVTQLKYQNPIEPMDNQTFIAQLAEFNALEELRSLNKQMATLVKLQQEVQDPEQVH